MDSVVLLRLLKTSGSKWRVLLLFSS